jgi:hypothetical protein
MSTLPTPPLSPDPEVVEVVTREASAKATPQPSLPTDIPVDLWKRIIEMAAEAPCKRSKSNSSQPSQSFVSLTRQRDRPILVDIDSSSDEGDDLTDIIMSDSITRASSPSRPKSLPFSHELSNLDGSGVLVASLLLDMSRTDNDEEQVNDTEIEGPFDRRKKLRQPGFALSSDHAHNATLCNLKSPCCP